MEMLSEHQCQGWLEGYLLTGRHGFFSCYEAFIHIVDSMFNQHAKWLEAAHVRFRGDARSPRSTICSPRTSGARIITASAIRIPAFIDLVVNKKADVVRVYLPPDANTLLAVTDHCLRSRNYVNVIVAGKQPEWQWLDMDAAIGTAPPAQVSGNGPAATTTPKPDVVMACAGDVPTLETLAAVSISWQRIPALEIRVVNVVDLMTLQPPERAPAWHERRGVRRPVHRRQADHLRVSRVSVADPPADLSPAQSSLAARAGIQGAGYHDDAIRHGRTERSRSHPSGARRRVARAGA